MTAISILGATLLGFLLVRGVILELREWRGTRRYGR